MDAVAEMAGVTKPTLYYHFDSKENLVVAYLEHASQHARASLLKTASHRQGSPMERLLGAFDDLEARLAHEKFRGCPFINAAAELADSEPTRLAAAAHKESVRAWFETQLTELGVSDVLGLSEQLMLLTDGATSTWLIRRDPRAARRAREAAVILLEAAVRAKQIGDARFGGGHL
jgi:AcrR family transcriptional regulator